MDAITSTKQELLKHLQTIQTLRQSLSKNDEIRNALKQELAIVSDLVSKMVGMYNSQIVQLRDTLKQIMLKTETMARDLSEQAKKQTSELMTKLSQLTKPEDQKETRAAIEQLMNQTRVKVMGMQTEAMQAQKDIEAKIDQLTRESGNLVMMLSTVSKTSEQYLIKDMFTPPEDPSKQVDTSKLLTELKADPKTKKSAESIETIVNKMHTDYATFLTNEKKLETRSNVLKDEMNKIAHLLADNEGDKQIISHMFDLMNQSISVQCDHAVYVHNLKKQVMDIVTNLRKEGQKLGRSASDKQMLTKLYSKMDEEKRVMCEMKITQALYQENIAKEINELAVLKEGTGLTDEQRVKIQALVDGMHQSKMMYPKEGFEMTKKGWTWLIVGYVLLLIVIFLVYKFLLGGRI